MKKTKGEIGDIQTVFSLATILIIVVISILFFSVLDRQLTDLRLGILRVAAANNEFIVRRVTRQIESEATAEDDVLRIVRNAESDGSRYWMLFSEDSVLFEKNENVSSVVNGMSYSQIRDYHFRAGGHNINGFMEQISKRESFFCQFG